MTAMHRPIRCNLFGGILGRQASAAGWAVSRPLEGKRSAQPQSPDRHIRRLNAKRRTSIDRMPKVRDGEVMLPSGSRKPTARRAAQTAKAGRRGRVVWSPAAALPRNGKERKRLRRKQKGQSPLALQPLSRFISSASIHSARLTLTFWSMPWMARVWLLRPLAVRADNPP